MGKKAKVGKQRRDKFYHLAKETGFRSRAAFKLIQLNRKFEFLQKSRVCLDLCAAPGGWMQVAQQNMPISSVIIGVDLFPIKQIPGTLSIVGDITTEKCRTAIHNELKTWKADIVLHDGAPNVGKNWLHDAYSQACLTLSALKLATQFLRKGGWFITKVFRSKDYNPLIWVLKQLFQKVHATKPQASRTESAEIFVVCQNYIAPDKIDAKFTDAKYVFKDWQVDAKNKLNIFHPEKTKAKAEGYPENDYTLHYKVNASDLVKHHNGIDLLEYASEIIIDDPQILNHEKTTTEIQECFKDIKVLGRKDLRKLMSWWKTLHEQYEKENQIVEKLEIKEDIKENDEKAGEAEDDDLKDIDKQINDLQEEELQKQKRQKKKVQKERKKLNEKLNLKMILKGDDGPTLEADDLFSLKQIKDGKKLAMITEQEANEVASDDENQDRNHQKQKYIKYDKDNDHLDSSGLYYKDSDSELEMESESDGEAAIKPGKLGLVPEKKKIKDKKLKTKSKEMVNQNENETDNPLLTDLDHRDKNQKMNSKAELWFERDAFKNLITEKDEDADLDKMVNEYKKKGVEIIGEGTEETEKARKKVTFETAKDEDSDSDSDYSSDDDETVAEHVTINNSKKDGFEVVKTNVVSKKIAKKHKLTPEELALGTLMVNSKKAKRDLIDGAWNRYTFNDEHLPDWFVKDEQIHMRKPAPVPKEMIDEYSKKLDEINVRPIKKVVEAKARKKRRTLRKMQKAKKKAETILESGDISEREKAQQIKQMYKKASNDNKKEKVTYVVAKKFSTSKRAKRPAGIKGRFKMVDPRMKKEVRAQKNKAKKRGGGGGGGGGRKGKSFRGANKKQSKSKKSKN